MSLNLRYFNILFMLDVLLQILKTFDLEQTGIVTKGELRRVLDRYCIPLTTNQLDTLLENIPVVSKNGSVNYQRFANHIAGREDSVAGPPEAGPPSKLPPLQRAATTVEGVRATSPHQQPHYLRSKLSSSCSSRSSSVGPRTWSYSVFNIEELLPILQNKISQNLSALLRALRLFDFNSDHSIQKFRLKKILENFCCPLNEPQFEKLLQKFSFSDSGSVNYIEFLRNLGMPLNVHGFIESQRTANQIAVSSKPVEDPSLYRSALISDGQISTTELQQLLTIFRKKVEVKFDILKKAFIVLDPKGEGYVSVEEMFRVLCNFIFPMSTSVFINLMERCAFKATGRIQWLTFLRKFQDPQSRKLNGSTFPTKSELICHPTAGLGKSAHIDELLELLCKHVSNNYSSFREAFLEINKTHKGKITKKAFLQILKQFQFNINSSQANTIFSYLDPNKHGYVSYHHFLELFEQKESLAAHRWLNSTHKVVEPRTKVPLTDDMLRDTLRQNIVARWTEVVTRFRQMDHSRSGFVSPARLRTAFIDLFPYLRTEDVDRLAATITLKDEDGKISYMELFNLLGIDPQPTDSQGVSAQIMNGHDNEEKQRLDHQANKMKEIDLNMQIRSGGITSEEIVVRLRDCLLQNRSSSYEIFKKYECDDSRGGIGRAKLKKILLEFGYMVSDNQLGEICAIIGLNGQKAQRMDYNSFLLGVLDYGDKKESPLTVIDHAPCNMPQSNHKVNAIRGDNVQLLDVLDIELWLRRQIANGYSDLRSAFKKLDVGNKGHITRVDLQQLLELHNVRMKEGDFEVASDNLGIADQARLSYPDFLDRFQLRDDLDEGHKWLNSCHKYNEGAGGSEEELGAEAAAQLLSQKVHQQFSGAGSALRHLVTSGTGNVTFRGLVNLLNRLQMRLTKPETKRLWRMYNPSNKGSLLIAEFARVSGLSAQFAGGGDLSGTSSVIIQQSHENMVDHLVNQELRHQRGLDNQVAVGGAMTTEGLYDTIKRHIQISYPDCCQAFKALACSRSLTGSLTLEDLNRLLSQIHLFVTDDRFVQLAARLGYQGPQDSLNYEKFCSVFQEKIPMPTVVLENHETPDSTEVRQPSKPAVVVLEEVPAGVHVDKIVGQVSKRVSEQLDEIKKTFLVLDPAKTGRVSLEQLRNLLAGFCVSMSDRQFAEYISKMAIYVSQTGDNGTKRNEFDYETFLASLGATESSGLSIGLDIEKQQQRGNTESSSYQQTVRFLQESMCVRPRLYLDALKQRDYAMIGVVSKNEMKEVFDQLVFCMPEPQFERFWLEQKPNEFGNVDYAEMVQRISGYTAETDMASVKVDRGTNRPGTASSGTSLRPRSVAASRLGSVVGEDEEDPNERLRKRLEKVLNKHWQTIFNQCKAAQKTNPSNEESQGGLITLERFCEILCRYDDAISADQMASLNLFKTLCSGGRYIRFGDLIRSVVLSSRGSIVSQESAIDIQRKFDQVGIKTTSSDGTRSYFPLLYKLRRQLLQSWRPLRHAFLQQDLRGDGSVSASVCMSVLSRNLGRVNPDLFYHLMTLYDSGTGHFSYRRFIEHFLQTATTPSNQ